MPALQRGAAQAEERLLGALRQPVPQNGRVHLHIIDSYEGEPAWSGQTAVWVSTAEKFFKIVLGETRNFPRKFRGVSAPALYKNPAVNGDSYEGAPAWSGQNCSHCNFQGLHPLGEEHQVRIGILRLCSQGKSLRVDSACAVGSAAPSLP